MKVIQKYFYLMQWISDGHKPCIKINRVNPLYLTTNKKAIKIDIWR